MRLNHGYLNPIKNGRQLNNLCFKAIAFGALKKGFYENKKALFEDHQIRRVYDEESESGWFSVIDIVQVLTQKVDYQTARKYGNKLKRDSVGYKLSPTEITCCRR